MQGGSPGIAMGLELRVRPRGDGDGDAAPPLRGLAERLGVSGGVTPFPLARDSPIAFTSSLTDTPDSSAGISLQTTQIRSLTEPSTPSH